MQDVPLLAVIAEKPLQLALVGDDRAALAVGAGRAAAHLRTLPGVADVTVSGIPDSGGHETLDRRNGKPAARLNANLIGGYPILAAGPIRLRPILMTTAATILGMLPIALGLGAGAELRAPMAVAIIGGLLTSTALSLVVVPVVYAIFDRIHPRLREARAPRAQ